MEPGESRYAVSVEICHILTEPEAERLAKMVRDRLNDIEEDVYVCVSRYEQVRARRVASQEPVPPLNVFSREDSLV